MTRDLLIGQLRLGNTGAEILQILETLAQGEGDAPAAEPTADPIAF